MKLVPIVIGTFVLLHGVVHLMGTASYLKLGTISDMPYKTSILGGRVDLGKTGIGIFGLLFLVSAIGFVVAAIGIWTGWAYWPAVLMAVATFSLVLTLMDWSVAYVGATINLIILLALWFRPDVVV